MFRALTFLIGTGTIRVLFWTEKCVQMRLPAGVFGHGTYRCCLFTGTRKFLINWRRIFVIPLHKDPLLYFR